jgi:hypothetical protein
MDLPEPECPSGYPAGQLEEIFGKDIKKFRHYMTGQTVMFCTGKRWHYIRGHSKCPPDKANCQRGFTDPCIAHCNHNEGDDYTWLCDYLPGGYEEPSECVSKPHGLVTYRCDVERYFDWQAGKPVVWD